MSTKKHNTKYSARPLPPAKKLRGIFLEAPALCAKVSHVNI